MVTYTINDLGVTMVDKAKSDGPKARQNNIDLIAVVAKVFEPRQVNTRYGPRSVQDILLIDDSTDDQLRMTLWRDHDSMKEGDKVSIEGAYATVYENVPQLGLAKTSTTNVIKSA